MTRARATALLVTGLLWAGAAGAQDLAGTYRLDGTCADGERYRATLALRGDGATLRAERSARRAGEEGLETWAATAIERDGDRLKVTWAPLAAGSAGLAGALAGEAGEGEAHAVEARYELSEGGRVRERLRRGDEDADDPWSRAEGHGQREGAPLRLLREARFEDLLGDALKRYEASGLVLARGALHVVFDNAREVAVVSPDLRSAELIETHGSGRSDFEGLAWDARRERFYAVVEAREDEGEWRGRVWELDRGLDRRRKAWLDDLEVPRRGKGYEGLTHVRRGGEDHLLALLEGDDEGRGRVEVFQRDGDRWRHVDTLFVPAAFEDYSGIDVRGDRVAVVSQTSSLLWVGRLRPDAWAVDAGEVHAFPRAGSRPLYPAVEGVAWLDDTTLAVVSDRAAKAARGEGVREESIHVFALP